LRNTDKPAKPGLRDAVAELSEENARLKAQIAELESAR
jgi:cell division protein FtsB